MYTFIHPTKCGGTAIEVFLKKVYPGKFVTGGHGIRCTNTNNPIIVVRDVRSRFMSMFKYWKRGSNQFKRTDDFLQRYAKVTILDFVEILKEQNTALHHGFTGRGHFMPTVEWMRNVNYKNIIVVKYKNDLNESIQRLVNCLGIENKGVPLTRMNVSVDMNEEDKVLVAHPVVSEFINSYFKEDIELMRRIDECPHDFKCVL